jgi:predicted alpha-1,6-mannanase (GH76 family)
MYFNPESGSFPTAIDWTSTVLATHLINYAQQTADHRYFSHLVAFFHNQNVTGLIRQNYDDQLWVVLTFLRGAVYAAEHEPEWADPFLQRATVFYDLASAGWDNRTCGGGMVWGRWVRYKNAVTSELYIAASVGMYEAFGEDKMLENATRGWVWLKKSGMLNTEGLFNDGLDSKCRYHRAYPPTHDRNNQGMTWTYNQGIILSGLSGLYKFTGDEQFVVAAQKLIDSVLESYLVPCSSGILVESCDPFRTCDEDQWMFKGIFFQHLGYFLQDLTELDQLSVTTRQNILEKYVGFIQTNACAVWDMARQKDGKIGNWWDGPPGEKIYRQVGVETHGSGIAAILCAVRVGQLLELFKIKEEEGVEDVQRAIRGLGLCGERWNDNL